MAPAASRSDDGPLPLRRRLKRRWKRARRAAVGWSARALLLPVRALPFRWNRRLLPALTRRLAPMWIGAQVARHLELAFGAAEAARLERRVVRGLSESLGLLVAETLAFWRGDLPPDYVRDCDIAPVLANVLAEGRGVVAVTGHVANWELLGVHVVRIAAPRPAAVIARRLTNPVLEDLVASHRRRLGLPVVPQDASLRAPLRILRAGGLLGLVPDQDIKRATGIFVPFFGRPAFTPTGPAALAHATGAPLVTGFSRRTPQGLVLELGGVHRPDPAAPRAREVERLTRAWSADVEARIRRAPEDWVWFHARWRTTPEVLARRRARAARR